jgi:hypothetical protein
MIKNEILRHIFGRSASKGTGTVSYYTLKQWNFYLWGNDFFKSHPRIIIGIDFAT